MLGAERLLVDRQRALVERPRRRQVALVLQQGGEVVEARRGVGMLGAEHLLADRQRALVERPRRRQVALVLQQAGEVVEARRRVGMLGAEHLLADRQRALVERPRRRQVALGLQQEGEVVEARRGVRMLGAERLLADRQRALDGAAAPPNRPPGRENSLYLPRDRAGRRVAPLSAASAVSLSHERDADAASSRRTRGQDAGSR